MFNFDSIREIYSTISKNKLRTGLTCLAVAWGIFMLILLIGVGNGFSNAAKANFADRSKNKVYTWPRSTTIPYKGFASNRKLEYTQKDYDFIKKTFPEIDYISPTIETTLTISYGDEYGSWRVNGVSDAGGVIYGLDIQKGRFINKMDVDNKRKVILINPDIEKVLFKGDDAIGKRVIVANITFTVIGVYSADNQFGNDLPTYIPISTAQTIYRNGYSFDEIVFTLQGLTTLYENEEFVQNFRTKMASFKNYDPADKAALGIWNSASQSVQANKISTIISIFIKIIGAASLITGIIGVGNIMLITVKERTREIGIRKAIGARPLSILNMIISESVFITAIAGYIGLAFGVVLLEGINYIITSAASDRMPFKDLSVDIWTVLLATLTLILCGVVAGLIPAIRAAKVSPIESMRAE